jgi:hypothetical protein
MSKIRLRGEITFDYDIEASNIQEAKDKLYNALKRIQKPNFFHIEYDDLYTEV